MLVDKGSNDWIGSTPLFYNTNTNKIATSINEVIDFSDFEIDPEGFNNYLEFGYSVFGHTVVKNVNYLQPNEKIEKINGKIVITKLPDPIESTIGNHSTPSDTIEYMEHVIKSSVQDDTSLILPLSGGLDSRLLAYFLSDTNKDISCYSYGISSKQEKSFEVLKAKEISRLLGLKWSRIELENYPQYINQWDDLYGCSVHSHGMYQMEFYDKINVANYKPNIKVVSGIIGDAWAGSVVLDGSTIKNSNDLSILGYTHGLSINSTVSKFKSSSEYKEQYWNDNKDKLSDSNWNVVLSMRHKMMLLRYLFEIPHYYNMSSLCPFLNFDLAMRMLNLDWSEKNNRLWERKFLDNTCLKNIDNIHGDNANQLDQKIWSLNNIELLNTELFDPYIERKYIEHINCNINRRYYPYEIKYNKFINGINTLGYKGFNNQKLREAISAYMVLYPIQQLLSKVLN